MPKFLEAKLKAEYPNNPHAVYGTLNTIGAMVGNQETPKGRVMQAQHDAKLRGASAPSTQHPHRNLGRYLHAKKGR